jgi:hypothetical protein
MSYGYEDCLEIACMDRFHCSLADLKVLENLYTDLAEQSGVDFRILGCMNDLHLMVEYTYTIIRDYIVDCLETTANVDKYITLIPDDVDDYVNYEIDFNVELDIRRLAKEIREKQPVHKDLTDVKFNSIIDEAIDVGTEGFEDFPEHVAERILQLAFDKGLIRATKEYKGE